MKLGLVERVKSLTEKASHLRKINPDLFIAGIARPFTWMTSRRVYGENKGRLFDEYMSQLPEKFYSSDLKDQPLDVPLPETLNFMDIKQLAIELPYYGGQLLSLPALIILNYDSYLRHVLYNHDLKTPIVTLSVLALTNAADAVYEMAKRRYDKPISKNTVPSV